MFFARNMSLSVNKPFVLVILLVVASILIYFPKPAVVTESHKLSSGNRDSKQINDSVERSSYSCSNIAQDVAVKVVGAIPEVKEFMKGVVKIADGNPSEVTEGAGLTNDERFWRVHVYHNQEITPPTKDGVSHMTQTFNWYQVGKCAGKVSCVEIESGTNKSGFPVCVAL